MATATGWQNRFVVDVVNRILDLSTNATPHYTWSSCGTTRHCRRDHQTTTGTSPSIHPSSSCESSLAVMDLTKLPSTVNRVWQCAIRLYEMFTNVLFVFFITFIYSLTLVGVVSSDVSRSICTTYFTSCCSIFSQSYVFCQ